ncbi:hypothetical protein KC939_02595 [Candidatus Saccharibacteria bacterium]|nr:hypothetical protein [Candidatus Saccharibacteria bacterium]
MSALTTLAQTVTTYDYQTTTSTGDAGIAAFVASAFLFFVFLGIALYVFSSIVFMKMFQKANEPGWAGWVPIYNTWKLLEISGYPGWLVLIALAVGFIPVLNLLSPIVSIALSVILAVGVGRAFGKRGAGWYIFLFFLPLISHAVIAFGDAKYKKPTEKDLLFKI